MESHLNVVVRDGPEATVLSVSGELDMASSFQLRQALDRLVGGPRKRTVLDLAELQFIDVTGLRVLLRAREEARQVGGELVLTHAPTGVRRLLDLTGAADLLGSDE